MSSPLTSVHLHILHCEPLKGPFLELIPIGLLMALSFSPSHSADQPDFLQFSHVTNTLPSSRLLQQPHTLDSVT